MARTTLVGITIQQVETVAHSVAQSPAENSEREVDHIRKFIRKHMAKFEDL